tara:strand:- start:530 stop:682 length:153 start_codon:yes stop_codon:yes gene_type:complete
MLLLGGLFSAKANDLPEVGSDCIWKNTEFEYFCDTCGCGVTVVVWVLEQG